MYLNLYYLHMSVFYRLLLLGPHLLLLTFVSWTNLAQGRFSQNQSSLLGKAGLWKSLFWWSEDYKLDDVQWTYSLTFVNLVSGRILRKKHFFLSTLSRAVVEWSGLTMNEMIKTFGEDTKQTKDKQANRQTHNEWQKEMNGKTTNSRTNRFQLRGGQ